MGPLDPSILIAIIALAGTVLTAIWGRRSARDTHTIESRRFDLTVLEASIENLRRDLVDERDQAGRDRTLAKEYREKVDVLEGLRRDDAKAIAIREEHIDALEVWIRARREPPPPPRPTAR